jgi:pimeloyl-ACP methyl ester carboxylesterase
MGGCIALAFAAAYPARTAALALIDTTAWYGAEAPHAFRELPASLSSVLIRHLQSLLICKPSFARASLICKITGD